MKLSELQLTLRPDSPWPLEVRERFEQRAEVVQHAVMSVLGNMQTQWTWKVWVVAWDEIPTREPHLVLPDGPEIGVDQANLQTPVEDYILVDGDETEARRWIVERLRAGCLLVANARAWPVDRFEAAFEAIRADPRHVSKGPWVTNRSGDRRARVHLEEETDGFRLTVEVHNLATGECHAIQLPDRVEANSMKQAESNVRRPRWKGTELTIQSRAGQDYWNVVV